MNRLMLDTARLARPVVISSFVASLAAGLGGCGGTKSFQAGNNANFTPEGQARLATVEIDPSGVKGTVDAKYFNTEGRKITLPQRWVGEAVTSTAEIEARRAAAQAAFVRGEADELESTAAADATLQRSISDRETADAFAARMREVYGAKNDEAADRIFAAGVAAEAEHRRREGLLSASVQEWQAEVERMRSESDARWTQALAEHENMLAQREAVQQRGTVTINQMRQTADMTEQRAIERVRELRNNANVVADQTAARVAELGQRIQTVGEQTRTRVDELTAQASSLRKQSTAEIEQLLAESKAIESQDTEEKYRLSVIDARVNHDNTVRQAEQLRAEAEAQVLSDNAAREARTAEADRELQIASVMFDEAGDNIGSEFEKMLAAVSVTRAEADRVEREARAKFVQAEIDARVAAMREQATHDVELSKAERDAIAAEAEAVASRTQAQLMAELAKRFLANAKNLPGNDVQPARDVTPKTDNPRLSRSKKKPEVVEPARIAEFRAQLAESSRLRNQGDADEQKAIAARDERRAEFDAWFAGKQAEHEAWLARIDAWHRQARAATDEMFARADSLVGAAGADRQHAEVDADSLRRSTAARIAALRSAAENKRKTADAKVEQLTAQAESTRRSGESEVAKLKVQLDATNRRGTAQSQQYLAEADALEAGQRAVVAQMRKEIESGEQVLAAELQRLDESADVFVAIAKANYDESVSVAETFERISIANANEMTAAHTALARQSDADIGHARNVAAAEFELGQADVGRIIANAEAELGKGQARDIAARGTIAANARIANAAAGEQLAVASADEAATISRFNSRIASTQADRNRAYADLYLKGVQNNTQGVRAVANANAHNEIASAALARLSTAAKNFEVAAHKNWDSRLALPPSLPSVPTSGEVYGQTNVTFPSSTVELYEFDNDQNWVVAPTDD